MALADDLTRAVEACDRARVTSLLLAADEPSRRGAASTAQRLFRVHDRVEQVGSAWRMRSAFPAAVLALFGTGTPAQVVAAGWLDDDDEHRTLTRARPREWRQELAERAPVAAWALVRGLVRDGLADEPLTDAHALGLVARGRRHDVTPLELLRADPALLDTTLWRLFEVEGGGEDSLAAHDKYSPQHHTWSHALSSLAATGELDRQRLLDASLAALRRDWAPFRAQWMTAFHTGLAPTLDERDAREEAYLALLASQAPAVVGFAVSALAQLQKAERLDPEALLEAASPAVLARAKGTASAAVRLVARCAPLAPDLAAPVLRTAEGSEHPEVARLAGAALATLTGRPAPAPTARPRTVSVAPSAREVAPRHDLDRRPALVPVADLEDLVGRLSAVLERADDPDEVELVLDGLSRLCAAPAADRVLAPVAKRAAALARREDGGLPPVLAAVVVSWSTGDRLRLPPLDGERTRQGSAGLQLGRLRALAERLAVREASPLAACPTHAGGWLHPAALLARLETFPEPAEAELAVALLRLPTRSDHPHLAAAVARVSGRTGLLRRRAPAGPAVEALGAEEPALRFEVSPVEQGYRFLALRPSSRVPLALDAHVPVHDDGSWIRWTATVWPRGNRVRDAMAAELLAEDLDWWGARWGVGALLEPLLEPDRPLGPEAAVLLALGLLCKESTVRRLAVDVLATASEDGRLRGPALADALALVLPAALPSRLLSALTDASRAGQLPALVTRDALVGLLPHTSPSRRGAAGLVGLLADLTDAHGLPADPALQDWLSDRTGSLGRQARRLLVQP